MSQSAHATLGAGSSATAIPTPEQVNAIVDAAESLEKAIPKDTFDVEAVSRSLADDPEKIFQWVRDNTRWVPYRGALRGPRGVLMDRVGNSLDRSLLLAELLRHAGHAVRLAHATLTESRARELMTQLASTGRTRLPRETPSDEADSELNRVAKAFQIDPNRLRAADDEFTTRQRELATRLANRVEAQAPFIADAVGKAVSPEETSTKALAALMDHWWLQEQLAGSWSDLDVTLGTADRGFERPTPDQTFSYDRPTDEIPLPRDYVQEVEIRVVIEQWTAGRFTQKTVLAHRFRPAQVLGQLVVLQHAPLKWPSASDLIGAQDPPAALKAAALDQTEWRPFLTIGTQTIAQSSFTDRGDINERPTTGTSGRSGGTGSAFAGGLDALGGGAEPAPDSSQLTREWIEYETDVPGETATVTRREVFNVDPSVDAAQRLRRALSLLGRVEILPTPCRLSRAFVQAQQLRELSANRKVLIGMMVKSAAGDKGGLLQLAEQFRPVGKRLLDMAMLRMDWSWVNDEIFLASPNILSYRTDITDGGSRGLVLRHGIDIVTNNVGVYPTSRFRPFYTRLVQGVTDTNLEALLVDEEDLGNAGALLAASPGSNQWITMRRLEDSSRRHDFSDELWRHIERSLRQGFVVVAPLQTSTARQQSQLAFWMVNPSTGDTLGIGGLGWGQALSEYVPAIAVLATGAFLGSCLMALPPASSSFLSDCLGLMLLHSYEDIAETSYRSNKRPPPPPPPSSASPDFYFRSGLCGKVACR